MWIAGATLVACTTGNAVAPGAGGAGQGGQTAGDAASDVADASDAGDASEASDTSVAECTGFDNDPPGDPITISLVNRRTEPILVNLDYFCFTMPPSFTVTSTTTQQPLQIARMAVGATCEELQKTAPYEDDCSAWPATICIQPGGHYDEVWDGRIVESAQMPGSCFLVPVADAQTCQRLAGVPAGAYRFDSTATPASSCACTASDAGSCEDQLYNYDAGSGYLSASVTATLPAKTVTLAFQ